MMADPGVTTLPYMMTPQQMAQFQQQLSQYGGTNTTQPLQVSGPGGTPYSMQPTDPFTQLMQGIAPFITGAGNLATTRLDMNTAREAAGMADPFSGERGQYMRGLQSYMTANPVNPGQVTAGSNNALAQLTNLIQNPGSLTTMPGYQFGLNQAMEGVNRGAGASGLLNSGNRLAALEDRGNSYAQGWQNQIFNQLLSNVGANNSVAQLGLAAQGQGYNELQHLSGADTGNPAVAGQMLVNGRQQQANSVGSGIAGLTTGAGAFIQAIQRIMNMGGGSGGWNGATPGAANGQWDVDPGNVGGGANGGWDVSGIGGGASNADWDISGILEDIPYG